MSMGCWECSAVGSPGQAPGEGCWVFGVARYAVSCLDRPDRAAGDAVVLCVMRKEDPCDAAWLHFAVAGWLRHPPAEQMFPRATSARPTMKAFLVLFRSIFSELVTSMSTSWRSSSRIIKPR